MAAAANAITTRIGATLGRRELMLGFMSKIRVGTWKGLLRPERGNAWTGPGPVDLVG
jgi:hypothetical protein